MTKPLLILLGSLLLVLGNTGCGTGKSTSSASSDTAETIPHAKEPLKAPSRPGIDDTYDKDDTAPRSTEEGDDAEIEIYGKQATPAEWLAAVAFVKSYFAVALAENGAAACKLLTPSLASGLGGSYEKPPNPSYLRGKTCAEVMTKLFEHRHKLVAAEAAGLEVTDVRVTSRTAFILLAFKGIRERRYMGVERDGKTWKLEDVMDSKYP